MQPTNDPGRRGSLARPGTQGGNPVLFGVFLLPNAAGIDPLRAQVQMAESAGFDYVSIQDHPYAPTFLDTFALIGYLLGQTKQLRFMSNVANLPLRPAPMLAKTSAALDLLSGGRFELGLGAGRSWDRITGLGGPRLAPGETVTALDEAITVLHELWRPNHTVSFPGRHYPLVDVQTGPAPAHQIGIWLGVAGPRMLNLLGRRADGWIAPLSTGFETKPAAQDLIDAAARAAGREPSEIRRVIQLVGSVTDAAQTTARPRSGPGNQPIRTTAQVWAQIITELVTEERFDTVNFIPEDSSPQQLDRFATEVIPATRSAIVASAQP
jgi:alkanesulfonate monooxygenase SsuD/methylene tetrahydromethanopterin reductase-like flavin-dependent oxidoreductase (luciferase family)